MPKAVTIKTRFGSWVALPAMKTATWRNGERVEALALERMLFLLIGETWIDHHRICRQLRRTGRALPWWNLLLLLFVVLMPLASRLLQTQQSSAVMIYAGVYGGMGVAKLGFWIHAVKCRFVLLPLDVEGRSTSFRLWATPAVSLAIGLLASQGAAQAIRGFLALPGITYGLHRASLWSSR